MGPGRSFHAIRTSTPVTAAPKSSVPKMAWNVHPAHSLAPRKAGWFSQKDLLPHNWGPLALGEGEPVSLSRYVPD